MPKRTPEHVLEAYSRYLLHSIFAQQGWVSWDLNPDYGEDILVRIFLSQKATPYSFFVQVKCIADASKKHYIDGGKYLRYQIKLDHLKHWKKFWEPVVLVLCDKETGVAYWEVIQDYLNEKTVEEIKQDSLVVHVPRENILDEKGLKRIAVRSRDRFKKFESEREAALILVDILEELGLEVEYVPQKESVFIKYPDGSGRQVLFGSYAEEVSDMAVKNNISEQELINRRLKTVSKLYDMVEEDPFKMKIGLEDVDGNIIQDPMTVIEMMNKIEIDKAIDQYEDMKKEYED